MKILSIIKPILLIVLLMVGIFFISLFAGPAKNQIFTMLNLPGGDVKGASTQRAEELTQQFSSDIGEQVDAAQKNVLDTKVSDLLSGLNRLQKIPQDVHSLKEYVQKQVENFTNKK